MQTTLHLIIMLELTRIGATAKVGASLLKAYCITVHYCPSPTMEGAVTSEDRVLKGTDMMIS
jgi:hypothetical protein